ncbi:MAG TPA: hypothetical protein VGM67_09120 [Gemmatimonadaceae bacterium]|jgi:hypothetical protein
MTHIRSALVAGLLVFGGAVVAAAQAPAQSPAPQAQQQGRQANARRMGARRHGDPALKGMTLSATEKANLKAVQGKYASQLKALRSQAKDSTSRQQARKLMEAERADTRGALSADNQTKFDANVAQMKQHMGKRGQRGQRKVPATTPGA